MRLARVRVTPELLLSLEGLPFPIGTRIVDAKMTDEVGYGRSVEFVMEHPALPDVGEGDDPPIATPTFKRNVAVEFVEWGLK